MLVKKEVIRGSFEGKKLMQQIYDLRYEVFGSIGWLTNPKENASLVKDEFDDLPFTTHFAVTENNQVIGAIRMVRYSPKFKLPLIKNSVSLETFKNKTTSISEAGRLVVKQDRKYPGCVLQVLSHSHNYTLKNNSEFICAIGNPDRVDLYKYLGHKVVNKEVDYILDKNGGESVLVKGTPIIMDKSALNNNLDLGKYDIKRELVIIKNG